MRAVCPPSACLLISLPQPWPPATVTLLQISWHHNWTIIISPLSLTRCSFVWQIIARFSELLSAGQQCLIFENRPGVVSGDPLPCRHSKLSWFLGDAAEWPSEMPCCSSVYKLLISASSNAVFAGTTIIFVKCSSKTES